MKLGFAARAFAAVNEFMMSDCMDSECWPEVFPLQQSIGPTGKAAMGDFGCLPPVCVYGRRIQTKKGVWQADGGQCPRSTINALGDVGRADGDSGRAVADTATSGTTAGGAPFDMTVNSFSVACPAGVAPPSCATAWR